ncbi:MAG: DUF6169 family protein [Bacteroidota bacterium]
MYEYNIEQGANGPYFYFTTDFGLTYYVAFREMPQESYPLDNVYSLDFGEVDRKKGKKDSKISSTILEIIIMFLEKDSSLVLHFLCENDDKRQLYRKRLFSRWFSICNLENWIKYDYDFENADYNISFIYNSLKYETDLMESEILLTLDVYERAKEE